MSDNYFITKVSHRLTFGKVARGGRNFLGRICVFHRGGGNKRNYRLIDYYKCLNSFGFVLKVFKDSFRTAYIALVVYESGLSSYIILSEGVKSGGRFYSGNRLPKKTMIGLGKAALIFTHGSSLPLRYLKLFTKVNNVELRPTTGAALCRAAGVGALFSAKFNQKCLLKLNSGWQIFVSINCMASIGIVSNSLHHHNKLMKAGASRWRGIRPTVRGIVKNPCDHPHGGGEGKNSPPSAQVSPWGRLTKGTPTKNRKIDRIKRRMFKKL